MAKRTLFFAALLGFSTVIPLALAKNAGKAGSAAACTFEIQGTGEMTYTSKIDGKDVKIAETGFNIPKACLNQSIVLKLTNSAKSPPFTKATMGHNLVIAETANVEKIANAGISKAASGYIDASTESLILGHAKLIGPGESSEASIKPKAFDAKKDYSGFCTFPGHIGLMKFKIAFVDGAAAKS